MLILSRVAYMYVPGMYHVCISAKCRCTCR